jgi:hypothetical protein
MRKLAFLSVAFALAAVSFYGCDAGPSEPDPYDKSAVDHEQATAFKWYMYDSDFNSISETIFLECLNETVLVEGDYLWWIWEAYPPECPDVDCNRTRDAFWLAPWTTMVGPSGTWTILRQAGPEPGKWGVQHDVGHVTWENAGTRARLHTSGFIDGECRLTGPN